MTPKPSSLTKILEKNKIELQNLSIQSA
jgi:hypothetical protein